MSAQAYDVHAPCDAVPDGGAAVCGECFGQGCAGCGGQGSKMATDDMLAISVRQPWAWAICHAGKRCENRDWKEAKVTRARNLVGSEILIHAGLGCTMTQYTGAMLDMLPRVRTVTDHAADRAHLPALPYLADLPRGAIVARAKLADVVQTTAEGHRYHPTQNHTCILCGALGVLGRSVSPCPTPDPWAIPGCVGLVLDDVLPLDAPVPFSGALGFFRVPRAMVAA